MRKKRMVVYEMIDGERAIRVLILKDGIIELCQNHWFWDTKLCEIDPINTKVNLWRSSLCGYKDFAVFRNDKIPYLLSFYDKNKDYHIFRIDKEANVEIVRQYIRKIQRK